MSSPKEYLSSPFVENVLQILPQGHDKNLKQAFYNTAATLFVVIACCGAVAVYYILEAFLRPLLWAVLCGTFLHPFKHTLTAVVRRWMQQLRSSGTPIVVGTALVPVQIVGFVANSLETIFWQQIKSILTLCIALPTVYLLYHFGPLQQIYTFCMALFTLLYHSLSYFNAFWVWTIAITYIVTAVFYFNERSIPFLKRMAVPVWTAVLLHVISVAGPFRIPLLLGAVVLTVVGFVSELGEDKVETPDSRSTFTIWRQWMTKSHLGDTDSEDSVQIHQADLTITTDDLTTTTEDNQSERPAEITPASTQSEPAFNSNLKSNQSETRTQDIEPIKEEKTENSRPSHLDVTKAPKRIEGDVMKVKKLSDMCFIALFWGVVLVKLWMNAWLLQLLPLLVAFILLKKLGVQFFSLRVLRDKVSAVASAVCKERMDVLAPKPIRGLAKMLVRGDGKIVSVLESSLDKLLSVLLIVLLLIGTIIGVFFMFSQVQRESVHLVTMASNVVNTSLHPQVGQWVPDNDKMQEAMDSMVSKAYVHGREYLGNKVQTYLNGDAASKSQVKEQVLDVWDNLYQAWLDWNTTAATTIQTPEMSGMISLTNLTDIWSLIQKAKSFELDIVGFGFGFINENLGMVMSVMESVWAVVSSNISLATNILWTILQLLFGGGTALLNLILSIVIFLTTLFYLLASSGEQYKPVELFMSMTPAHGQHSSGFGIAVEEAIGSVFLASFKMAAFYGVYTWLTHTAFGVQIVYIPAGLAAVFAAIPFLGTYWAAVPAVIELWLVQGQSARASMLFISHLLPTYIVDTAIYSDIKGGHPYMTGLAIAGGMYWLGLEGAIMGPILLCCLVVAFNVYSTMMRPEIPTAGGTTHAGFARTPKTRSLPTARK